MADERATTSGGLVKLSIQLAPDQLVALDAWRGPKRLSRAAAARQLLDAGLEAQQRIQRVVEAVA